jgi:phosphatidylserine/phosphatidylglycerophosphate/cardiolipin synthase-like enzyme
LSITGLNGLSIARVLIAKYFNAGIWMYNDNGEVFLTTIGSPNYGYRSSYRDFESQVILTTSEESVKMKIKAVREIDIIY